MSNIIFNKNNTNFVLGSFYQSNLSNQSNINIEQVAKYTKNDIVAASYKLRPTYALAKQRDILDALGIEKLEKKQEMPQVVPLGLFLIESYPLIQQKTDSAIVCFEFDKEKKLFAAITVHKGTVYCLDGFGEFIGDHYNLVIYLKEVIRRLSIRDIHSTVECFQLIEDALFHNDIRVKKIGLNKRGEFGFTSEDLFWSKKSSSICEKVCFSPVFTKSEQKAKIIKYSIIGGVVALLAIGGGGGYLYSINQVEDLPPPPPPPVYAKVMTYNTMVKDCFKRVPYFMSDKGNWNINNVSCDFKNGVVVAENSSETMANSVVAITDFLQNYKLSKSESATITANGTNGSNFTLKMTLSKPAQGIKVQQIKPLSIEKIKSRIVYISSQAEEMDFVFNVVSDKSGKPSKWTITSGYSPIYLENKYQLFDDLYIVSVKFNVSPTDASPIWTLSGNFNGKTDLKN